MLSTDIRDYPEGIILPVDKPYRWTSADLVRKIKFAARRYFNNRKLKVGHAGTLDPLATGILLVCIGPATRRADELQASRKQYIAGVSFGATTASYDLEKELYGFCPADGVGPESIEKVFPRFLGEQDQVAPLFSAKSVDGVRAYETARQLFREGRLSELSDADGLLRASRINIYGLELLSFDPAMAIAETVVQVSDDRNSIRPADVGGLRLPTATIKVDCSKGTYIRSLARDLGEALGTKAFLSSLRRTGNGGFTIDEALQLDEVLEMLKVREEEEAYPRRDMA